MGVRNQEGESVSSFAIVFDKAILNTFFTEVYRRTIGIRVAKRELSQKCMIEVICIDTLMWRVRMLV